MLASPAFDDSPQIGTGLPAVAGVWSGDLASVVTAENDIAPRSGIGMLRFEATYPSDQSEQDQRSELWQLVDLEEAGIDPAAGAVEVEASAWVNRVELGEKTDRTFALTVQAHEGSVSDFQPANALVSDTVLIQSDADPETWEQIRLRLDLTETTAFVALAVVAEEDRSDNAQGEFDGHYVDDAGLVAHSVDTQPVTISGIAHQEDQIAIEWSGGVPPYVLQRRNELGAGNWEDLRVTDDLLMQVPLDAETGYFRIVSAGGDTEMLSFNLPFLQTVTLSSEDEIRLSEQLNTIHPDAIRSRIVGLDLDAVEPVHLENQLRTLPIQLPLFEDATFQAVNDRVLTLGKDQFSWIGKIEGEESSQVVLSFKGGRATGLIQNGTQLYEITQLEENRYGVVEIDQSAFPQEMPPDPPPLEGVQVAPEAVMPDQDLPGRRFINVMVVYTEEAADGAADIELTIQNAVDVTNASYEDSGIQQRLHLVHTAQVDYEEEIGTSIKTHRNRLQDPDDGFMDDVHDWRAEYEADLVALIVENSAFCGIAFIMEDVGPSFADWGFSVTVRSCAVGNFSFAHELGHNMGARHDRFVDNTDGEPFSFNHGFVNVDGAWRTVMAYNNACTSDGGSCTRVGRWSNPNLNFMGSSTGSGAGNDDAADNSRTLLATDFTVSQFQTLGVNEAGDRFGASVAMGDFDGDGLEDLAVGAPHEAPAGDPESGLIFVYAGTPFGHAPWKAFSQEGGLGGNEAGDLFGFSLATGDFNGDGFDDLAIGAPGESPHDDPQSGIVFLFEGSEQGLSHWHSVTQRELGSNEAGDEFAYSLAVGDFNQDGKDDLAVGAPGESPFDDPQSGAVFVFQGTTGELDPWQVLDQTSLEANETGDRFGEALAVGDFDADGSDDLAVGAPAETVADGPSSGGVYVFQGSSDDLLAGQFIEQASLGINEADDQFGQALAAGDFNHDGWDDLAVGAPGEAPGSEPKGGTFFVYQGSDTGLSAQTRFTQSGLGLNETDDLFAAALSAGDFNGDGIDDLAVGAPGEAPGPDPRSGYLYVYEGSSSGLLPWDILGQRGLGDNEAGDEFAYSLAAGDVDGDGLADLVVGAPGESPASDPQSGFVFGFKGNPSGKPLRPWVGITEEQ